MLAPLFDFVREWAATIVVATLVWSLIFAVLAWRRLSWIALAITNPFFLAAGFSMLGFVVSVTSGSPLPFWPLYACMLVLWLLFGVTSMAGSAVGRNSSVHWMHLVLMVPMVPVAALGSVYAIRVAGCGWRLAASIFHF